jgi:hypothetical protein
METAAPRTVSSVGVGRDPSEFREQLEVELRHLRRSAREYDDGDESEAQRLAVMIRKLVHDTGRSTSLLTHLGAKSTLRYIDTRPRLPPGAPPGSIILHAGLVIVHMQFGPGGGSRFSPALDGREQELVEFNEWWEDPFVTDQHGHEFARSDFVLSVSNQDGGAHIDRTLGEQWAALTREGSLGVTISDEHGQMQHYGKSLALATVRQVAWELDATLSSNASALGLA